MTSACGLYKGIGCMSACIWWEQAKVTDPHSEWLHSLWSQIRSREDPNKNPECEVLESCFRPFGQRNKVRTLEYY
jgi:hypothetical protein